MAKILIVDDSKTSRKLLKNLLEENGHEVVGEAGDGMQGVNAYKELNPEIVTMDITMPVLNGIEALDLIKLHDKDAKVVMVTAAGQQMKMMEALKKGAVDFVQKPFEPEKIISIIDKVAKQ
ncbi:MAG: response regulator [Lachnospiraceae bacterium]|nr:response regulator [Lachnospira sp.]MBR6698331.1 response regulator [Lachnospiraceae bacterium]